MRHLIIATAGVLTLAAAPALAQEADPAAEAPAAAAAAEAPEGAGEAAVSDDELLRFGRAVVRIQEINATPAEQMDDEARQAAMAASVEDAGLDVESFNRVGQAVSADASLQQRVVELLQADQAAAGAGAQ